MELEEVALPEEALQEEAHQEEVALPEEALQEEVLQEEAHQEEDPQVEDNHLCNKPKRHNQYPNNPDHTMNRYEELRLRNSEKTEPTPKSS